MRGTLVLVSDGGQLFERCTKLPDRRI